MATTGRTRADLCVVLVDDDEQVIAGLRRGLRVLCPQWSILAATSVREAGLMIKARSDEIDVVVADVNMPGMHGDQLLTAIRHDFPHIRRITLSGVLTPQGVKQHANIAERVLVKPCSVERLRDTICDLWVERGGVGDGSHADRGR